MNKLFTAITIVLIGLGYQATAGEVTAEGAYTKGVTLAMDEGAPAKEGAATEGKEGAATESKEGEATESKEGAATEGKEPPRLKRVKTLEPLTELKTQMKVVMKATKKTTAKANQLLFLPTVLFYIVGVDSCHFLTLTEKPQNSALVMFKG